MFLCIVMLLNVQYTFVDDQWIKRVVFFSHFDRLNSLVHVRDWVFLVGNYLFSLWQLQHI